jgi:MscS family membrane protein
MFRVLLLLGLALSPRFPGLMFAAEPAVPAAEQSAASAGADRATQAAAATAVARRAEVETPDFLEHLVDSVLGIFDVRTSGNTVTHYAIAALLLVVALLARRIVTGIVFALLRKVAARTTTTLDDKLFPALEGPAAAFIMVVGIFAALKVLKLSPQSDAYIAAGSQVAFTLTIFWALWRTLGALLNHGQEIAQEKHLGIAAFMPWIRKSLMSVFVVLAVLLTIQSLGYDVKTILAGLGIGGLAFALAAQDTLANIFGAIVVAIDQPFKIGETVKIGQNTGGVEDIGLRSTRIRLVDKSLMVVPNKTVAAETIQNLSRYTKRRVEQVLGLTYDTTPAQMEAIVAEIRKLIEAEAEVDRGSVHVYFRDLNASSLDVWIVYETNDPDFTKSMVLRQRLNLAFMRAVEARGLAFAFPTQTIHVASTPPEDPKVPPPR